MQSSIIKHSVEIAGHKTSISLEEAFWRSLKDIARSRRIALNELVSGINSQRTGGNLSSATRLFVLNHYQSQHVIDALVDGYQLSTIAFQPQSL